MIISKTKKSLMLHSLSISQNKVMPIAPMLGYVSSLSPVKLLFRDIKRMLCHLSLFPSCNVRVQDFSYIHAQSLNLMFPSGIRSLYLLFKFITYKEENNPDSILVLVQSPGSTENHFDISCKLWELTVYLKILSFLQSSVPLSPDLKV